MTHASSVSRFVQWSGFVVSVISAMLCGIIPAFNVYAVQLKQTYRFNQTQVDMIGSSTAACYSFMIVASIVYKKYGYRKGYLLAICMAVPSYLLMSLSTYFPEFFNRWIFILCILQYIASAGVWTGLIVCSDIGVQLVQPQHTAKVISLYVSAVGLGKVYFCAIYQLFFNHENGIRFYFLNAAVSFACTFTLSYLLHRPRPSVQNSISQNTADGGGESGGFSEEGKNRHSSVKAKTTHKTTVTSEETEPLTEKNLNENCKHENSEFKDVLRLSSFHLIIWAGVIFQASFISMMNISTEIAEATGVTDSLTVVYPLAIILTVTRLSSGAIYDYFNSVWVGFAMLFFCHISFASAVFIGMFWLTEMSLYPVMCISAIGMGAGYNLPLVIATAQFGKEHFAKIMAANDILLGIAVIVIHISSGVTYDNAAKNHKVSEVFCSSCFFGSYIIMLSGTLLSAVLLFLNMIKVYRTG